MVGTPPSLKNFLWTFLSLFLFVYIVKSDKVFKNIPTTVKSYENDTVTLPCNVEGEGTHRVRWYKGEQLLGDTASPHQLLPARVSMLSDYSLQIEGLQPGDTADYVCEILRPESKNPLKITHTIEVQHSPTVTTIPYDGYVEVKKGQIVDIGCDAQGVPTPILNWRKNGELMSLPVHRSRLRFKVEDRNQAGIYECVANNGVGDPIVGLIRLIVQDAPQVTVENSFVHTNIGLRASLEASVDFATPPARTYWYKDGKPVKTDDRITAKVENNIHKLVFRQVRKSDFGNYTFKAENTLGMVTVTIKLTGVPNISHFKVDPVLNKATGTSFTLLWEVDSAARIIEYNLWVRPYYGHRSNDHTTESTNSWVKIVIPGNEADGPIQSASYTIQGLTPSTVYEAMVTSRNIFGWSKQSSILHFATEDVSYTRTNTEDNRPTLMLEEISEEINNETEKQVYEKLLKTNFGSKNTFSLLILIINFYLLL